MSLSKDEGTSTPQRHDAGSVEVGHVVLVDDRVVLSGHVLGVDDILDTDGDTVERATLVGRDGIESTSRLEDELRVVVRPSVNS